VLVPPGKTIIVPDEANSLTFDAPEAALQENSGSLVVAGALTVNSGFVSLNEAEHDWQRRPNGRSARLRQCSRHSHNDRRRTARHRERNPHQRARVAGCIDASDARWCTE
jgi:hypothetical protein